MNNEPVAWMSPDGKVSNTEGKLFYIPLYTHPVKELTDEEILNEWLLTNYNPKTYVWANDTDDNLVLQFAKAILRKAQEK